MLNLVFVGSIDHGKSTLIARMLCDTNSLPEEKIEEVKRTCEKLGKKFEFAYILDALEEEREKQITIDTTQIFFSWNKKDYCIIDAPGHKEFLKNMLTGATQAHVAVLIVSAKEGMEEQTKRHALLLKLLGIEKIIVVVNKMDLVNYEKQCFEKIKNNILKFLNSINLKAHRIIPISAINGDNLVMHSKNMPWYKGKTLLEILEEIEQEKKTYNNFVFPVQDVYIKNGEKILVGNIVSGKVKKGEEVFVFPKGEKVKIEKILLPEEVEEAEYPKAIAIALNSNEISRGDVLAKHELKTTNQIKATIFAISEIENSTYEFSCSTQKVKCKIKIEEKLDIETLKPVNENVLENGDIANAIITLEKPVVVENFYVLPELGKFTIEKEDEILAGGIIL